MDESVYDIEAGDDPVAGWHPGQPGNEVGGRRAARLAAAAAEAAAWTPTSPDVVASAAPIAGGAVYDLSAELHPSDEQPWYVPGSTGGGAAAAPGPSSLVGGPAAVPPAQPHAAPATPPAAVPASTASYGYPDAVTQHLPVVPAEATTILPAAPVAVAHQAAVGGVAHTEIGFTRHAREVADADLVTALAQVVYQDASDLHVTADAPPTVRVDGSLRPAVPGGPWSRNKVIAALKTLLTPEQAGQFDHEQELDFAYSLSPEYRFRVNYYQQRGNWGAAFRIIPTQIKTLKQLGIPDHVGAFARLPRGLVLVTGPTGSGKSTTLAALIDLVNETRADHIVTVEDPIEFMHDHKKAIINQREVGADTHSFAAALKHVLRQDPDVILIGELRDLETISVALTAAETGHLVFATLHTQSAPGTIDRVIDVFPPHQQGQIRTQLAATLEGVVCQTLVPKANGSGRVVATEIMRTTPAIANLVREGKTYQITSAMQAGRDSGMHTMDQDLAELVNVGTITRAAAMEKVQDEDGFDRLVQRVESPSDSSAAAIAASEIDFGDKFSGGH
ncbi:type IV pilus twitching motility protein PilT [Curtobacterium sp. Csp1]|uniref:type IV pilus twitching motility protein PilT n=1 Tax=unclassified Curtobacterium TaxID=257496 RepID=UPI000E0B739E|nr:MULTISPECIES: type IV pilus twitching motility protein PilT [unclassified Curtobacterium]QKS12995.1 type IV pilus twitching motility protein PilT [Curtobacterium sp. csp3]QKS19220.1 type IV pilus twitching motility protein PilT [Curtobacterium sp. Csp1]RDI01148.1 twitching motility protein PilT [Curtobacterium sp. AG1037]